MTDSIPKPIHILVADDDPAVLDAYRELFANSTPAASASVLRDLKAKLIGAAAQAPIQTAMFNAHYC